MTTTQNQIADANLTALGKNPYPGRGFILGLSQDGTHLLQVYWIMGRSENSRNRIFKFDADDGRLFTEAADPAKVKNPSLIIYNAMLEAKGYYVVSNGHQTNDVMTAYADGDNMDEGLLKYKYEPDGPNFTPRITGVSSFELDVPLIEISVLRKSPWDESCEECNYRYQRVGNGFGYCVTTYMGDGDPLPSFRGEPLLLPLEGNAENVLRNYWHALNAENLVALAVKSICRETGVSKIVGRNKHFPIED